MKAAPVNQNCLNICCGLGLAVLAYVRDEPAPLPDRHFAGGRAVAQRSRCARDSDFIGRKRSRVKLAPGRRRGQRVERVSVHPEPPSFTLKKEISPAGFR